MNETASMQVSELELQAESMVAAGEVETALGYLLVARELARGLGDADLRLAQILDQISHLHVRLGNDDDAWTALDEALQVRTRVFGDEHPEVDDTRRRLLALAGRTRDRRGMGVLARMYTVQVASTGPEHPLSIGILFRQGTFLHELGEHEEAEEILREVLSVRQRLLGADSPVTAGTQVALSRVLMAMGRYHEAETMCWDAWSVQSGRLGKDHEMTRGTAALLQQLRDLLAGRPQEAAAAPPPGGNGKVAESAAVESPAADEDPIVALDRQIAAGETAALLNARGLLLAQRHKRDEALADFVHASKVDRTYVPSRVNQFIMLSKAGRDGEAALAIDHALGVAPDLLLLHVQSAMVKYRDGQMKHVLLNAARGATAVARAEHGPADSVVKMLEQALEHIREGRAEDAWWAVDAASARDREDVPLAIVRAVATDRMGNTRRAVEDLDGLEATAGAAEPLLRIARAALCVLMEWPDDAEEELTAAREAAPTLFDPPLMA